MMSRVSERFGQRFHPSNFEVVKLGIDITGLSPAFHGYRIVHISDIHYGQWISAARMAGVAELINNQQPDLVAITGDFVSYSGQNVGELCAALKAIRARDAVVAVLGNHDYWLDAAKVRSILNESNVIELNNDVRTIARQGNQLHFAGVDSVTVEKHQLDRVLHKLPLNGPAVLLAHEPYFADVSAGTKRFNLQLSGHSHGGQFVIPGIGSPFLGGRFRKYSRGRYQVGDMALYTSRGIGANTFWLRVNCAPEVTVIDLQSR